MHINAVPNGVILTLRKTSRCVAIVIIHKFTSYTTTIKHTVLSATN